MTDDESGLSDDTVGTHGGSESDRPDTNSESSDSNGRDGLGIVNGVHDRLPANVRSVLSGYGPIIIVVFLLVAAGGGYLTYTAVTAPATQPETVTAAEWTTETEFDHGTTVTTDTAVFASGEELQNRPLYFTRLSPELEGSYVVSHDGNVDPAIGVVSLQLVVQATDSVNGEEIVHWRETEQLGSEELSGVSAGSTVRVPFSVDTTELSLRIQDIEDDLGASPGTTEVLIVADTVLETEAEGERLADQREEQLVLELNNNINRIEQEDGSETIEVTGGTYSVEEQVDGQTVQEITETIQVPFEPSPFARYGGPLFVFVGLLGAAGFGLLYNMGAFAVSGGERQRLTFERTREDYDEWISRGQLPDSEPDRRIRLDTLEDLVNVAIDSNRRVIERLDPPRYAVWVDDIEYVFEPPEELQEAIESTDDETGTVAAAESDTIDEHATDAEANEPESVDRTDKSDSADTLQTDGDGQS